ncbi:4-hydroxybenzoate 3-monooxygenase [Frankia sp. Cj3]|uniref:4-hydroxybenzoate 3-monooxygenase n=1 Tax=Frankia sp. Cj3 TaxID=2880976 RepID=UPI001EF63789|nr:4-hydroxybenzoate 3-monooxygenase [Frankia sp. Cj3]
MSKKMVLPWLQSGPGADHGPRGESFEVAVIGAGVAGLIAATILKRAGIDTVVLERRTQEEIHSLVRAGAYGPGQVAILERHGLADKMRSAGKVAGMCEFRHRRQRFVVDCEALTGHGLTIYPQHLLVGDLLAAYLDTGGAIEFAVSDVRIEDLNSDRPAVRFVAADSTERRLRCHYIAGCDGHQGVSRGFIPPGAIRSIERTGGRWAWIAALVGAGPSVRRTVYSVSTAGFAGQMLRDEKMTRYYLQVESNTNPEHWPEDRIWTELHTRLAVDEDWTLIEGALLEPVAVVSMDTVFYDPIKFGRLLLAGDAARRIPPTAAKGASLAIADAEDLAHAVTRSLRYGDDAPLAAYSDTCLRRSWIAQDASTRLSELIHVELDNRFSRELQDARLDRLRTSPVCAAEFADLYLSPR